MWKKVTTLLPYMWPKVPSIHNVITFMVHEKPFFFRTEIDARIFVDFCSQYAESGYYPKKGEWLLTKVSVQITSNHCGFFGFFFFKICAFTWEENFINEKWLILC